MKSWVCPVDELVTVTLWPASIALSCAADSMMVCAWLFTNVEVNVTPALGGEVRSIERTVTECVWGPVGSDATVETEVMSAVGDGVGVGVVPAGVGVDVPPPQFARPSPTIGMTKRVVVA